MNLISKAEFSASEQTFAQNATDIEEKFAHYSKLAAATAYNEAYWQLRNDKSLADADKKAIIDGINQALLFDRDLEWGNHGIRRSFRFWTPPQKTEYLQRTVEVIDFLKRTVTPFVSFGFGSVLGMVRDLDFIPHDDDMDVIIALPRLEGSSFAKARDEIRRLMELDGYTIPENNNLSHHTVVRGSWAGTDVFIGFIDPNDRISWFPSRRGGLAMSEVFPTKSVEIFGVECPIPAQPERYLEVTYGTDWRNPIPNWNHPWDSAEYLDLVAS